MSRFPHLPQSAYRAARSRLAQASAAAEDAPQHFMPPTARELRAQAVQRLQVGLFGLAAMLLLVGLASIIMSHARQSYAGGAEQGEAASRSAASGAGESDPLADIGVAPSPAPVASRHPAATH